MKRKISKRDIAIFLLGVVFMLVLDLFLNWEDNTESFKQGWKDGIEQIDQ